MSEPNPPGTKPAFSAQHFWEEVEERAVRWDDIVVGWKHEWEVLVTQDTINGYADGVEDRNPWYGPFPTEIGEPVAPPLLLSRACKDVFRPLGTWAGHVLVFHDTTVLAPCRVNTRARLRSEIVAKSIRRGRRYHREATHVEDAETGAPLLYDLREYLVSNEPAPDTPDRVEGQVDGPARPEDRAWAALPVPPPLPPSALLGRVPAAGEELPPVRKEMHLVLMKMRAWGGHNAIHWDPDFARARGFPGPIAAGQMIAAILSEMCVNYFGAAFFYGSRILCKYVRPTFAGDLVTARGVVRDLRAHGGRTRAFLDLWAEKQDGARVVVGEAESWLDGGK